MQETLKIFLNKKVDEYNQPFFIESDPVCIPHSFFKKQEFYNRNYNLIIYDSFFFYLDYIF